MKGLLSVLSALCLAFAPAAATQVAAAESQLSPSCAAADAHYAVMTEGDEEQALPAVYASDTTARQGDYAYINIQAENFVSVASLQVFVYYDPSAFIFDSSYENGLNSGNLCEVNDSGGAISLSALSLEGMEGSGSLWQLAFAVREDAAVGDHNITVAVGEVYSAALEPLSVSARGGKITVTERPATINNIFVYSSTGAAAHEGEEAEVRFYSYDVYGLAAADFEIEYDSSRLKLNEVSLGNSLLQAEGAIWSANTDTAGYIRISYINLKGIFGGADPLVSCSFTVVGNAEESVPVSLKLSGIYDSNQNAIKSDGATANVSTLYTPPVITYPTIYMDGYTGTDGQFEVHVFAEGETALAAGDFVVSYDSSVLECISVEKSVAENIVVVNPDISSGQIRFSFINENGISADTPMVTITFTPHISSGETQLSVSGRNLVDAEFNTVLVEYVPSQIVIAGHAWSEWTQTKAPTCTEAGEEQRVCANDPSHVETRTVGALGHDIIHHEAKAPTCTEPGWEAYDTCSRCDYTTYKEILATGHTVEEIPAVEPTCTEAGSTAGEKCSVCGAILKAPEVIPATGHTESEWIVDKPATCEEAGSQHKECTVCGATLETQTIPAKGHTEGNPVRENEVAATCTTDGKYDEVIYCTVCGDELSRETVTVKATGHAWGEWTQTKAPTCTEAGEEQRVCANDPSHVETRDVAALGHDIIHHEGKSPTCTEPGWEAYDTCSRCDYTTYKEISAKGHAPEPIPGKAATCMETGLTEGSKCSVCGVILEEQETIPALGHAWSEWTQTKEPTATEDGEQQRECSRCGEKQTQSIPAAGGDSREEEGAGCGIACNSSGPASGMIGVCVALAVVMLVSAKRRKSK